MCLWVVRIYEWREVLRTHTVSVAEVSLINSYTLMRVQRDSPVITQTRLNSVNNCQSICLQQWVCVCDWVKQAQCVCMCVLSQQYIDTEHFLLFIGFTEFYLGPQLMMLLLNLWLENSVKKSAFCTASFCLSFFLRLKAFVVVCTSNVYNVQLKSYLNASPQTDNTICTKMYICRD